MDNNASSGLMASGLLTGVKFDILSSEEIEKFSIKVVDTIDDVTCPDLGLPNPTARCSSCNSDVCDGHFGTIRLPATIYHPYLLPELLQILNNVCPGCKSVMLDRKTKGSGTLRKKWTSACRPNLGCKYCTPNSTMWYPSRKFTLAKDLSGKKSGVIVVELNEKLPKKFKNKEINEALPEDYWDFIPKDPQQRKLPNIPEKMFLTPYQVFSLLSDLDPKVIEKFVSRRDLLFLSCFPVTPNCHRVLETVNVFGGARVIFDGRNKAYKKLVSRKREAECPNVEIPNSAFDLVQECLNVSKLLTKTTASSGDSCKPGSKWIKEVILGKRTDNVFRMTVVGDPKIRIDEIGIPLDISEKMLIPEYVNLRNLEKLKTCLNLYLLQEGECFGRNKGRYVPIRSADELKIGTTVHRPLEVGDVVLINRPPSVHQHSLIALSVNMLPSKSVLSLNPLCCTPFLGDFDGDCLHGYVPQSINSSVELQELVSLNCQLLNGQNGRSLLSLGQDSLTAAHLMTNSDVFLSRYQMQQLELFCLRELPCPAILKAPYLKTPLWTGRQLFSMLLPQSFDFVSSSNTVLIRNGDVLFTCGESSWLRNSSDNIFSSMIEHCPNKTMDFLCAAQEVLCEWMSMRGLTVSLSDIYLSLDFGTRMKMINEVSAGLHEAERTCRVKQLMIHNEIRHILLRGEVNQDRIFVNDNVDYMHNQNADPIALSQVAIAAYKELSYDLHNVFHRYAMKDNSMLIMINAGSKGNLMKLFQQSVCLGLQHATDTLLFQMPDVHSCVQWNKQKIFNSHQMASDILELGDRHVSYSVVRNSFLSGLNPLECFFHAIASRGNFFSENADIPGTLTRKLMFYMRDLYVAYDSTVRSTYGNHVVQFSYGSSSGISGLEDKHREFFWNDTSACEGFGGQPVGALSACAISEAAYGALDQPIRLAEISPLLNLKNVLENGPKEKSGERTVSLFLLKKLQRWMYGLEYAALEVKSHLERVLLSDVVISVMILCSFSDVDISGTEYSPWVSHFHVSKEMIKARGLTVQGIIEDLSMKYYSRKENKTLPRLQFFSGVCSLDGKKDECSETSCITVIAEDSRESPIILDNVKEVLIPVLLHTVIKGYPEIKKVSILWDDSPQASRGHKDSSGELFLKVYMSENCGRGKFWGVVQNACIKIRDLIDWSRSRPDSFWDIFSFFGVDASWKHFLERLKLAMSDVGRTIRQVHLLVLADCLSVTGQFHGLNARGLRLQRDQASISAPFSQACFSNPSSCFLRAAKERAVDNICGTLDALSWGKVAPVGTGGCFDIIYSGERQKLVRPLSVYKALSSHAIASEDKMEVEVKMPSSFDTVSKNWKTWSLLSRNDKRSRHVNVKCALKPVSRRLDSWLVKLYLDLRRILHKYPLDYYVNDADKSTLMEALTFHPHGRAKIGTEPKEIKIGQSPLYPDSRCFILVRHDGTLEDFSYHKCVLGAVEQHYPELVQHYPELVPLFKRKLSRRC